MQSWVGAVVAVCAVVLTVALVGTLLALRRVVVRGERVLAVVEQELGPLVTQARALTEGLQTLTRDASRELDYLASVTKRVDDLAEGAGRIVTGLAGLTRAGQLIGMATGLRRGAEVFVRRFRGR
ncbi:MAG TPA: DUF948 domain-containing protein [Methylomirabilota bacterium]|jgi:uncharacterized protein YoxC